MKNTLLVSSLSILLPVLGFVSWAGPVEAGDATPCARKSKVAKVSEWCEAGGQKAAKAGMKNFVKSAKAAGLKLTCLDCHVKLGKDYPVKDNAVSDFKKHWKTANP